MTGSYVALFIVAVIVVAIYFWRSADPLVPFLLLVAAIQGGVLLKLGSEGGPVQTIMPFLGGWVVLALIVGKRRDTALTQAGRGGTGLVSLSALALLTIVAVTALIQYLRPSGTVLDRTGLLTLVQLGVLVAVTAYLLRDPRKLIWAGYVTVASGVAGSLLALAARFQLLSLGTEIEGAGYERVSGAIEDPNKFAYQLLIPLAFAVNLALASKTVKSRALFWTACALLGAGIVSTYSAGALVGLAAVAATAIILQMHVSMKRGLAALGLIVVMTVAVAATVPEDYSQVVTAKYASVTSGSVEQIGTNRGAAWEAGLRAVAHNPLMGSGLSTATVQKAVAENYRQSTIANKAAHNMYIAMAVGAGVLGLLAFLFFLGSSLLECRSAFSRAVQNGRTDVQVAAGCLLTALVVTLTQGLQLDLQMEKYLWLLLGAALAVRYWSTEPTRALSASTDNGR